MHARADPWLEANMHFVLGELTSVCCVNYVAEGRHGIVLYALRARLDTGSFWWSVALVCVLLCVVCVLTSR